MKKRIFPICLSFLISAAYVASGIYFVSCVIKNPGPNYAMLWIPQAVFFGCGLCCSRRAAVSE